MTNTTKVHRATLRSEILLSWDGGDPWGSSLSALGGLCDVLHHLGGEVPAGAGYSPGMGGPDLIDYPASAFLEGYVEGYYSVRDLEWFARVLDRAADLVPESDRY